MKLVVKNGYLYRSFWDKNLKYTRYQSLNLKDNQTNRRTAQKIIANKKLSRADDYFQASINFLKLSKALQEFLEYKNFKTQNSANI
ncbi:MAG: hypothetical protein IPL84_03930 [Chitinophagaceae bacterium]|nr:hypothetical protein [Chitinophagaceae bacterium]